MNIEYLGDKLKAARKSKNLTQKGLAEKVGVKPYKRLLPRHQVRL